MSMTENPICTVLLITYNHAPYVAHCIDSVLSQKTKYPFIIKIFDDASTDGSSDIIRAYAAKYPDKIEAHVAQSNQGAQANIWNAYASVDTKYCSLTETDDYWCDDERLELQISALEEHPECSFCGGNTIIKNVTDVNVEYADGVPILNNPVLKQKTIFSYDDFYNVTNGGYIPYQSARLLRSSCLKLGEVTKKEAVLFDFNQFYWFLIQGKYYYADKVFSVYQRTGAGVCSEKPPLVFLNDFIKKTIEFNEQTNFVIADKICTEVILQSYFRLGLATHKESAEKPIKKSVFKLIQYHVLFLVTFGKRHRRYKEKWKRMKNAFRGGRK